MKPYMLDLFLSGLVLVLLFGGAIAVMGLYDQTGEGWTIETIPSDLHEGALYYRWVKQ